MLKKILVIVLFSLAFIPVAFATTKKSDALLDELIKEVRALKESNQHLQLEITRLNAEQNELKKKIENKESEKPSDNELSDLEKELNAAISGTISADEKGRKTSAQKSLGNSGLTNPDIGAVGIISFNAARRGPENGGSEVANTAQFDEAEVIISGYVDPYHKYDLVLGFHEDEVGVEEAYLTKFDLPWKLSGRLGKFRTGIGFINQHHLDELPWAGEHIFLDSFLGEEGLTTTGVELKRTFASRGRWTPTFSVEVGSGHDHDATVAGSEPDKLNMFSDRTYQQNRRTLARLKNHFDLGKNKDISIGTSYLMADRGQLDVLGADFQFRSKTGPKQGWTVLGEYYKRRDDAFKLARNNAALATFNPDGYMLNCEYQWDSQWKSGLLWSEFDGTHRVESGYSRSKAAYLAFHQTEFIRYLLQFEEREMAGMPDDQRITLQLIFSTGYHRHKLK